MKLTRILSTIAISTALLLTGTGAGHALQSTSTPVASTAGVKSAINPSGAHNSAELIGHAKESDPRGFRMRLWTISKSDAFVKVMRETTSNAQENLEFFASISTQEQADQLVRNTAGKVFVFTGEGADTTAQLVDKKPGDDMLQTQGCCKCAKAWAAASAWIVGTVGVCAFLPVPGAIACAIAMGYLSLMPDFDNACK